MFRFVGLRHLATGLATGALSALVIGLAAGAARADERQVSWGGFYTGVQLGGAWSDIEWRFENASYFNANGIGHGFDNGPNGVIGGVLGGFNYQTGQWIVGIELAASAADMAQRRTQAQFPNVDASTSRINWLTSVVARLGYASDRWLVFAKAGWAGAEATVSLYDRSAGVEAAEDQWANGWTVGGGVAYRLFHRTSIGVAYDYADLNVDTKTITCNACGTGPGMGTPLVNGDITVQSVMARVTFHQ